MQPTPLIVRLLLLAACSLALLGSVRAQQVTILHSFGDGSVLNDGKTPSFASLIQGSDGNFYGTTTAGGSANNGTVFQMTPAGKVTIMHSFGDGSVANDGAYPQGSLVQGSDGNFYGTTDIGGGTANEGCIYEITPSGTVTILHSFGDGSITFDGANPGSGLIQDSSGNFFGTTYFTGTNGGGCVFEIAPTTKTLTILDYFNLDTLEGEDPVGPLVRGTDGSLYGTSYYGGFDANPTGNSNPLNYGYGTLFKMVPQGGNIYNYTLLHRFHDGTVTNDGDLPDDGLVQGPDGNFYGTTQYGGSTITPSSSRGDGTLFKMTPTGTVTILHSFGDGSVANDGIDPYAALVLGTDGNFYGTTYSGGSTSPPGFASGSGTVFKMTPQGTVTILHSFGDGSVTNDGAYTTNGLVLGANGLLYGLTYQGGSAGFGTIFSIDPAAIVMTSAATASGTVSLPFSYQIVASNNPTSYTAINLPTGLSLNATTGLISGTPSTAQTKTASLTISNGAGSTVVVPLAITIQPLPVPVITSVLTAYGAVGTPFSYSTVAMNNTTSYSASGLAGSGLSINPSTGIISGTPITAGPISVTLTATNATGPSAQVTLTIQILAAFTTMDQEYNFLPLKDSHSYSPQSVIQAFDGNFYGLFSDDGNLGSSGEIFKMDAQGNVSTFYSFNIPTEAGSYPLSFIQAADSNFYGTTSTSTIFKLTLSGQLSILHSFGPVGLNNGLIQGSDGNFYGTTQYGGANFTNPFTGGGVVFKMTPQGVVTILHTFNDGSVANDGVNPMAGLVQGSDGSFYGTTAYGGSATMGFTGTVFKLTPQGTSYTYTILHNFGDPTVPNDGGLPEAALIQGSDGNFYGTTQSGGGTANQGTVYQLAPQGSGPTYTSYTYTILHSFGDGTVQNDGASPMAALLQGLDGNYYGTTTNGGGTVNEGTIFELAPQTTAQGTTYAFTILHSFGDGTVATDGADPTTPLIQSSAGNFYGIANGIYSILAGQTATHVPIFTGSAYTVGAQYTPLSYTPKAAFGVSGSGAEQGNSVQPQTTGGGIMAALVSLLPQSIQKNFATTNWTLTQNGNSVPPTTLNPLYLNFDPTSGTISGTPTQAGTFTVSMIAHNSQGPSMAQVVTFYIDVAPVITSSATAAPPAPGTPFTYSITTANSAAAYGFTNYPGWMTGDPVMGVISGTPPGPGTYTFTAIATNTFGTTTKQITLTVPSPSNTVPVISSTPAPPSGLAGSAYTYQLAQVNPAITCTYSALNLPTGLFCLTSGLIMGVPSEVVSNLAVPVTATNTSTEETYVTTLNLTIAKPAAPVINGPLSATATEGTAFSYQIPDTGGVAGSYDEIGNLPAGLSLDPLTGIISGTPTTSGTFPITVDENGWGTATATLNLKVTGTTMDFGTWSTTYSVVGGATGTPLHDGVPNLLKYLFDIDPSTPMSFSDRAALPTVGTTTSGQTKYQTLTFRQYALLETTGITINVQTSQDMHTWNTVATEPSSSIVPMGTVNGDPIMQAQVPITSTQQFIRLNVVMP